MKYLKSFGFALTVFLILNLIITIFSYFDLFKDNVINIFKIITFIITFISSGIYIGLNSKKKAYLEGLKLSLIFIVVSLLLILVLPNIEFSFKLILYYVFIIILNMLGASLGINKKKTKN